MIVQVPFVSALCLWNFPNEIGLALCSPGTKNVGPMMWLGTPEEPLA